MAQVARTEGADRIEAIGNIEARDEWANMVLDTINEACKDNVCYEDYGFNPPRGSKAFTGICPTYMRKGKIYGACDKSCKLVPCIVVRRKQAKHLCMELCQPAKADADE